MPFSPLRPTLAQWCVLTAVMAGVVYLLVGLEADDNGWQSLPGNTGASVEYLERAAEELERCTVDDVARLADEAWHPWSQAAFVPAHRPKNVVWARVKLVNATAQPLHGILMDAERFADRAECYYRDPSNAADWTHLYSGEKTDPRQKAVSGRENAFPMTVAAHGTQTLYLRYEDHFGVWLSLNWWPQQSLFHGAQLRETLAEALYFGILLALLFYNAILWLKVPLSPTGSYLLYLGSFTLFMFFARSAPQMIGWPLASPWVESFLTAGLAASAVFLLNFAELFLELRLWLPKALRFLRPLRLLMIACVVAALLAPFLGCTGILMFPGLGCLAVHLAVLVCAIAARRVGAPQASYVMLALGALFAGISPAVAVWLHVLPLKDAARLVMTGSALEMLMLAVLISDRIGLIQQEKIAAQKALLVEAGQREIMQEAYADDLALEVRERTAELEVANADKDRILTVLGHDLRSPLTGLTRSAEFWADRVTGDPALQTFMEEAAQTGRSLLLLIEDLVMWARLRAGTGHMAPHTLGAMVAPVFALHRMQAKSAGIALEVQIPVEVVVNTDLVPVQALLRNLLVNALRAARHEVRVEAVPLADGVCLSVRDDGPGLPVALEAALKAADPGLLPNVHGLGLRLCLEISRALSLRLSVVTAAGQGAEFHFFLPLASS